MTFKICFSYNSFSDTVDAFKFIDNYINFHKEGILSSMTKDGFLTFDKIKIEEYLKRNKIESFNIVSNDSAYFEFENSITYRRNDQKMLNIYVCSIKDKGALNFSNLINDAAQLNFTTAFIYDLYKSKWQNEEIIANYKTFGRPYEHLPKKIDLILSPILGELIDISRNPGHEKETYTMALMAAPEMWFGPASWKYFNKEKVISFPDAIEIKETMPEVVYVKLFDWDTANYETPEILSLQKRFRTWTNMDEIEKSLDEKIISSKEVATLKSESDLQGKIKKEDFNIWDYINGKLKKKA